MFQNYIAIMLPEFRDLQNHCTANDWCIDSLPTDDELRKQMSELSDFISFFKGQESDLLYDGKNIEAFLFPVNELPDYYPSIRQTMRMVLKGLENWRNNRISEKDIPYKCEYQTLNDEIRTEILERIKYNPFDGYVIAYHFSGYKPKTWIIESEDSKEEIESLRLYIPHMFEWEAKHHKPVRNYSHNPKHGENGVGAHTANKGEDVSRLLCSQDHAAELLQFAIGADGFDTLYFFDEDHKKYIEFKAETKSANLPENSPTRNYHSYHIEDVNRVPKEIARKIKIIQKYRRKENSD